MLFESARRVVVSPQRALLNVVKDASSRLVDVAPDDASERVGQLPDETRGAAFDGNTAG
jgi:hypothetical protein